MSKLTYNDAVATINSTRRTSLEDLDFEIAPYSYEIECAWNDAEFYCFMLLIDGKKGWRLPTLRELSLIRKCPTTRLQMPRYSYWSAETADEAQFAWTMLFNAGSGSWRPDYARKSASRTIRPVRSLRKQTQDV